MGNITVGMDESECAAEALRWAIAEGAGRGWEVTALLAWTFLRQHNVDRDETHDPEYSEADAAAALRHYVLDAVGPDAAAGIRLEVVCERAATALVAAAAGSSLLVVGSHGYGGFGGVVMGSVSQSCLHHSSVPVAVIRAGAERTDAAGAPVELSAGKVVVGVDGSETSRRALDWALDEARARDGWVEVVHSWLLPVAYGYPTLVVPDLGPVEEQAEALVDVMLEGADTTGLARPVSWVVTGGVSTAGLIAERAADAELIVVGSRGVGGFRGMLVGSVAHHLAHHAPCPLVVVPSGECE